MITRLLYSNNQTISISMAGLVDGATAISVPVDNSTNGFLSADLQIKYKTGISTITFGGIGVYMARSIDGGTTYDDAPTNADSLVIFQADTDSNAYTASLDTTLRGNLPEFFKVAVQNLSGATFDLNPANFSLKYNGKRYESL